MKNSLPDISKIFRLWYERKNKNQEEDEEKLKELSRILKPGMVNEFCITLQSGQCLGNLLETFDVYRAFIQLQTTRFNDRELQKCFEDFNIALFKLLDYSGDNFSPADRNPNFLSFSPWDRNVKFSKLLHLTNSFYEKYKKLTACAHKNRRPQSITLIIGVILLFAIFGLLPEVFLLRHLSPQNKVETTVARAEPIVVEPQEIKMLFVGDIMLSRNIGKIAAKKKDYRYHFLKIASTTEAADLAFANLENPVSTRGILSGSIYSFRADPKTLEGLKYAGFDVVSIANNHIWDYGKQAFKDTLTNLAESGITAIGGGENYEDAHTPKVVTVGQTRVAFLAYTNLISSPAISRFNDDILRTDIAKAKKLADVVIVSFHWGDEYHTKYNKEQERVGKLVIDAGANLVVGHHPHVVQEVEEYKGGYILYSLGNFIFDQNFSEDTGRGLLVEVTLLGNKITSVAKKQVAFSGNYQPYILPIPTSSKK